MASWIVPVVVCIACWLIGFLCGYLWRGLYAKVGTPSESHKKQGSKCSVFAKCKNLEKGCFCEGTPMCFKG